MLSITQGLLASGGDVSSSLHTVESGLSSRCVGFLVEITLNAMLIALNQDIEQ